MDIEILENDKMSNIRQEKVMKRKDGFTLIELLVVVAIIAILMATIIPAIRKAKSHAQTVVCKTNLKQYGYAMTTYLADNDGFYPYSMESIYLKTLTANLACQWHDREVSPANNDESAGPLWPYLANMGGHLCPSFKSMAGKYGTMHYNHWNSIEMEPQYSYSQNAFLGHQVGTLKESGLERPAAEVAIFVEETMWFLQDNTGHKVATHVLNDTIFFSRHPNDSFGQIGDSVATYHKNLNVELNLTGTTYISQTQEGGMGNAVFSDGHVELVDPYEYQEGSGGRFYKSYLISFPKRGVLNDESPY